MTAAIPILFPSAVSSARPTVVGVADCRVVKGSGPPLVTYALGSCIAVILFDPAVPIGGILHFMLPESTHHAPHAADNPFVFADTGLPILIRDACRLGAQRSTLRVWIAGGAHIINESSLFHTGKKNYLAVRKILWKAGLTVYAEAIGGEVSRTVSLNLYTGAVTLRTPGEPDTILSPFR